MRAFGRQGRQILHPLNLELGHAGAAAAQHVGIAVRGAMVVEIPFHHRNAKLAAIDDGLLDLGDFLVAAGQAIDDLGHVGVHAALVGPADHHDADMHVVLLERVHPRLQVIHAPGLFGHRLGVDPVDADLLETDGLVLAQQVFQIQSELWRIGTFLRLADALGGMRIVGRLPAMEFTLSVRSFQVPSTPGTTAWPPRRPSVPTSRATRVTSAAKERSCSTMVLSVSLSRRISPRTSTVIFLDRSPPAMAVATSAMLRTWAVRLLAMKFTLSVKSFQVPATPGTWAWPPSLPSVPTSRARRVPSEAKALS